MEQYMYAPDTVEISHLSPEVVREYAGHYLGLWWDSSVTGEEYALQWAISEAGLAFDGRLIWSVNPEGEVSFGVDIDRHVQNVPVTVEGINALHSLLKEAEGVTNILMEIVICI